jgi:hypothetical protein
MNFLVEFVLVKLSFSRVVFRLSCLLVELVLVDLSSCRVVKLSHIRRIKIVWLTTNALYIFHTYTRTSKALARAPSMVHAAIAGSYNLKQPF